MVSLTVRNPDFFINVLIPFFDALLWHSKKELDYIDWRTVLRIKEEGKHFTQRGEGEKIVKLLVFPPYACAGGGKRRWRRR